jgi:ERCC4-type nuclease
MFIKIDTREKELINRICYLKSIQPSFKDINIVIETLPLGDIIICNENATEEIIIERKSINDLLSSIKDGRYEEQSYRLNGNKIHNHNIIYLIEGDINKVNTFKNEKQTLYSTILSLNYYKGFSVIRTFTIDETALFICSILIKIIKNNLAGKKPYYSFKEITNDLNITNDSNNLNNTNDLNNSNNTNNTNDSNNTNDLNDVKDEYVNVIKKVKKDNITINNIDEIMLCQIPGISVITASALIKKFNNLTELIDQIKIDENCLKDITYTNEKGQIRKITKTSITNLVKFLLKKNI